MPTLQAVSASSGKVIATLTSVSQHTETLGFNGISPQDQSISSDWPYWFRTQLQQDFGGVAIDMTGSVGSNERPQVFSAPVSRVPQQWQGVGHPAGCDTLSDSPAAAWSQTDAIWGERATICDPLKNVLFTAAATFTNRSGAITGCAAQIPAAPYMHTPFRLFDEDMLGYIFPPGDAVGIPRQHLINDFGFADKDQFGCGHSDDSESTGAQTGEIVGKEPVMLLDENDGQHSGPESIQVGRYLLPTADRQIPSAWMFLSGQSQSTPDRNTRGYILDGVRHWWNVLPDISSSPANVTLQDRVTKLEGVVAKFVPDVKGLPGSIEAPA